MNQERLEGTLYMFHNKDMWKRVEEKISASQKKLTNYVYGGGDQATIAEYFGADFDELRRFLPSYSSFSCEFTLTRPGIATLIFDPGKERHPQSPSLQEDSSEFSHILHIVTAQLFFFLRDIGHRHQHHNPKTDTIVDLYEAGEDDFSWRLNTLYSMYRKIIQYKRNPNEDLFFSSVGILAYARSFSEVCNQELGDNAEFQLPYFNANALQQSIDSIQRNIDRRDTVAKTGRDIIRTSVIAIIGSVLSYVSIISITDEKIHSEPSEVLLLVGDALVVYPVQIGVLCIAGIYVTLMATGVSTPSKWRWIQDIFRIFHGSSQLTAGSIFFGLAMFSLLGMVLVLHFLR